MLTLEVYLNWGIIGSRHFNWYTVMQMARQQKPIAITNRGARGLTEQYNDTLQNDQHTTDVKTGSVY